jgi:hypothetical protein
MTVERITIHCVEIADEPGSLCKILACGADAGVDFRGFVAFSAGGGVGKVCLSAKDPAALAACAKKSGVKADAAAGFIITDDDRVGAAADALKGLADAGISGVAGAAMVCDGQYHLLIVVSQADGDAAEVALKG